MHPTFPPRPCVNDTMEGSGSGEDECESGNVTVLGEAASVGQEE